MGIYRMMCRSSAVPCWRRKSTLIWTVLILGAATYLVYSRSHRHKSLSQIFMSQGDNDDRDTGNFWEEHGGDEIDRKLGKIKFKSRYKHKPVHRQHLVEEEVDDEERVRDKEEEIAREEIRRRGQSHRKLIEIEDKEERENIDQYEEEEQEEENVRENAIEEEDDGEERENIDPDEEEEEEEEENVRENVIEEEIDGEERENVDPDKEEEEEEEEENVRENVRENVIEKEDIQKQVEQEDRAIRVEDGQQSEEDERQKHHLEEHNANQEEVELLNNGKDEEEAGDHRLIDADARIPDKEEDEKEVVEKPRHRFAVLKSMVNKKDESELDRRAGVIDAPLPDKKTLSEWPHDRIEALFHNYVMIPQTRCGIYVRLGKKTHGGWDVCHLGEYMPVQPCLMYSFGFASDYTFEDDAVRRYGCETHYFDPQAPKYMDGKSRSSGVRIHRYGLSSDDGITPTGWEVRKLLTLKEHLQHDQPIDILKVDIEENEWRALPEMLKSGVMRKVRQFLLEVHVLSKGRVGLSKLQYIKNLMILRDLYVYGFRIAKTRPDETAILSMDGKKRPQNYEILFLRKI